jgi:hypothetical protein
LRKREYAQLCNLITMCSELNLAGKGEVICRGEVISVRKVKAILANFVEEFDLVKELEERQKKDK